MQRRKYLSVSTIWEWQRQQKWKYNAIFPSIIFRSQLGFSISLSSSLFHLDQKNSFIAGLFFVFSKIVPILLVRQRMFLKITFVRYNNNLLHLVLLFSLFPFFFFFGSLFALFRISVFFRLFSCYLLLLLHHTSLLHVLKFHGKNSMRLQFSLSSFNFPLTAIQHRKTNFFFLALMCLAQQSLHFIPKQTNSFH